MALNDDAVFTAANGYIYKAAASNVTPPTEQAIFDFVDEATVLTGFEIIGHTSRDDLPEFGFDGGDTETKGTWQKSALKTVQTDPPVDFVTFNLVQFDADTFELYYGAPNEATGASYGTNAPVGGETKSSFLVVLVDGSNKIAFYANNAGLRREDAIGLAVDDFGVLPMRATVLDRPAAATQLKFLWIPGVDTA
jgi:hypothetical protein